MKKELWTGSIAIKLLQGKPMPPESDFSGNYYTQRGQALEPLAIAEYELMTNAWLRGFANSQKGLEMLAEGLE